ncbi:pre-rRNA processing protein [Tulasnella sp. 418]|nr:pre-rRNA processing protein [Tulasnella sp. 418]
MPDQFFQSNNKRKRQRASAPTTSGRIKNTTSHARTSQVRGLPKGRQNGANIDDDDEGLFDDDDLRASDVDSKQSDQDEDELETPAQKRLRLAKLYLDEIKKGLGEGEYDAADIDRELIEARLQQDVLEHAGKVHLFIADLLATRLSSKQTLHLRRGHRLPVTCAVISEDGKILFSAGKEGTIVKWDVLSGRQVFSIPKCRPLSKGKGREQEPVKGHTDQVFALSLSYDGKYLVSGGKDRHLVAWDATGAKWLKTFTGHKDSVSSVAFRKASYQLYSASYDRTVKIFDISPSVLGYVETLFGHQDSISSIDCMRSETAITAGGRDRSVRFWKVVEESQLVFRGGGKSALRDMLEGGGLEPDDEDEVGNSRRKGPKDSDSFVEGSIDTVAMIDETTFLSGGDSGSICLWNTSKKKPLFTQPLAHGLQETPTETGRSITSPRWITALGSLQYSDIFASGSWDGYIRMWKIDSKCRSFTPITSIATPGFVNSLQLITPPPGALDPAQWLQRPRSPNGSEEGTGTDVEELSHKPNRAMRYLVLVAGIGQEPRLGRWLKLNGGVRNEVSLTVFNITQ